MSKKDNIYQKGDFNDLPFTFNKEVTEVFEDMIVRSVPGYISSLTIIKNLTSKFFQKDSAFYDLGCSLGAVTKKISSTVEERKGTILAIDNSEAMIKSCRAKIQDQHIEFILEDVTQTAIKNSSVVTLNFVLQFLKLSQRKSLIRNIYRGINKKGILIISEKIHFSSQREDSSVSKIHHDFKLSNGYSNLEVARKRDALEGVLVSQTEKDHYDLLKEVGFFRVSTVMKNLNFITLVAFKE
ncbi:MAG: carboxy-S-adenosyl-L-methionine synthase CmoA [Gammaproteobacteria bacterium]